jgi:hypothetical protein
MPINLDGVALANATAPILFQTCRMPIMDLRRYRQPDEVVQNMPTFLGSWGPGTIAPALETQVIDIDTVTNAANSCRFPIVSVALAGCAWIAPDQKRVGVESEQINWEELVTSYCTVANIADPARIGQIFNADGTLNTGNPYTLNIVRFAAALLREAQGISVTTATMIGDAANTNQFDGLYTQIDNGWEEDDDACDATLNVGNVINWDLLTGGDGLGVANPDAETVATTVTLWGQSFDVPAGWTLGDFLAYYADAAQANYGRGNSVDWEMHVTNGWRMAVLKALSCIQMCNQTSIFTDAVRERYERLVTGRIAELFGYGMTFPIFETGHLAPNTIRFGPREIGGVPTYGLVFKNIAEVLRQLFPGGYALTGSGMGTLPGGPEPLLGMTREQIAQRFEALATYWHMDMVTAICVRLTTLLKAGVLATDRHFWLKITNVGVSNFRKSPVVDVEVDDVAIGGVAPAAPTLSSPADTATTTDQTPDLTWGAVTGADSYDVVVATASTFADDDIVEVKLGHTTTTFTPATLPDNDTYYWRVRATNERGTSAWSATRSFTVDTTP